MQWNELKGIDLILKLSKIIPADFQIVLAGGYSSEWDNGNVKFIGSITDVDELVKLYGMADVLINPTLQETFGKTTAEAMACGTPVVALNASATPELVGTDSSCGILIDDKDKEKFLNAIELLTNEGNSQNYRKNCRERAEKLFSKENNINQYIAIYEELLNNEK